MHYDVGIIDTLNKMPEPIFPSKCGVIHLTVVINYSITSLYFISNTNKAKIEHMQNSATKVIESEMEYIVKLKFFEQPNDQTV